MKVKQEKRPYHSRKRAKQAANTREDVILAARRLFISLGWAKTTIAKIAAAAGVSNETVYRVFGTKTALLQELVSQAVRGDNPGLPLIEQDRPKQIERETDQGKQIELFAQDITAILSRVAPLMDVARTAAGTEPEMARLYSRFHQGRRTNLEWFAATLLQNGPLKGGLDAGEAGTILWRLASPELFLLINRVEKCASPAYAQWLADSLRNLLLD